MCEDYGIISLESIEEMIKMREKQLYLQKHDNKIWQGKNGRWYTYVGDRKLLKRSSLQSLEDAICEYYYNIEENPTFTELFFEWIGQKLKYKEICKGTYDRYVNDFNRYFKESTLAYLKIRTITEDDIDIFVRETISKFDLTQKMYSNFRTVILGTFKYAKRKHMTTISISSFFQDMDISKRVFKQNAIDLTNAVFNEDEIPILLEYLRAHNTIGNLGLIFAFESGVRCGELAALKFSDITNDILHVQRQEVVYKSGEAGKQVHEIVEYTKTEMGNRYIYLPKGSVSLITAIKFQNRDSEFIFAENGKRIYKTCFNNYLKKACRECGIPERTMHKIRRTYGTTLIDNNVEDSLIMSQMGHTDISTTRKYYYFANKNDEHKRDQINSSIGAW